MQCACTPTHTQVHTCTQERFFKTQCPALAVLKGLVLLWKAVGHGRRGGTGRSGAHSGNSKCHTVWRAVLHHGWVHSRHSHLWLIASLHRSLLVWKAIKWDHWVPCPSPWNPLPYHCLAVSRVWAHVHMEFLSCYANFSLSSLLLILALAD